MQMTRNRASSLRTKALHKSPDFWRAFFAMQLNLKGAKLCCGIYRRTAMRLYVSARLLLFSIQKLQKTGLRKNC